MSFTTTDPRLAAATARSILSCPAAIELTVDGVPQPLDDALDDSGAFALQDACGVPTFLCAPDGALAYAACAGRNVLLSLRSGLAAEETDPEDRWETLVLAGSLRSVGTEACDCCDDTRERAVVDVTFVLLTRSLPDGSLERCRVPLAEFRSPSHQLNRGYLQRSAEHACDRHQDELRRAVAAIAGIRLGDVIGVRLTALTPYGAELRWVDGDGARIMALEFPRVAHSAEELGMMLRTQLHPGIC
ncbi:hypothetical protein [Nocardioides sp.]|uniref:hypothetical protein n=1 Tax=Nocardioides sp. TaxID=35761 RepID=UPI0039E52A65